MKTPIMEMTIGEDRWGLGYDDHCVVVLRWGDITQTSDSPTKEGWQYWKSSHIPHELAAHISAIALRKEVYSTALRAAHRVVNQYIDGGRLVSTPFVPAQEGTTQNPN